MNRRHEHLLASLLVAGLALAFAVVLAVKLLAMFRAITGGFG